MTIKDLIQYLVSAFGEDGVVRSASIDAAKAEEAAMDVEVNPELRAEITGLVFTPRDQS